MSDPLSTSRLADLPSVPGRYSAHVESKFQALLKQHGDAFSAVGALMAQEFDGSNRLACGCEKRSMHGKPAYVCLKHWRPGETQQTAAE